MRSLLAVAVTLLATPAGGQTIYPIDRADILAGARFDFKVEFDGRVAPASVKVTVNGTDYATAFGKTATLRRARGRQGAVGAAAARRRAIEARAATRFAPATAAHTQRGHLERLSRPGRARPRMSSCSSATACRPPTGSRPASFPRASRKARPSASSPSTTCRTWRWWPPPAATSIITDSANSASAYATGHKSAVNAMGVYADRTATRSTTRRSRPSRAWSSAGTAWRSASSPTPRSRTRRRRR